VNQTDTPPTDAPAFVRMVDLASERLGGVALVANDEFFAEKENLLKPGRGVFIADKFTERGKWMDGWETRRRREPGYDWCIVRLGMRGRVHGFDVDTNHFLGNYPERCSIELLDTDPQTPVEQLLGDNAAWREVVGETQLEGGSQHFLPCSDRDPATHVRLNIYPDGGVARLRVYGEVEPVLPAGKLLDLAAIENGGTVVGCSCMFFGPKDNLIMPGDPANMGEGWETKRRRGHRHHALQGQRPRHGGG
jgi:allantoicase